MQKQEVYREKLQARMAQYDAKFDELKAKSQEMQADAKLEFLEQIDQVDAKRRSLKKQVEELQKNSKDAIEDIEHGIEKAWHEMETAFDKAVDHFTRKSADK